MGRSSLASNWVTESPGLFSQRKVTIVLKLAATSISTLPLIPYSFSFSTLFCYLFLASEGRDQSFSSLSVRLRQFVFLPMNESTHFAFFHEWKLCTSGPSEPTHLPHEDLLVFSWCANQFHLLFQTLSIRGLLFLSWLKFPQVISHPIWISCQISMGKLFSSIIFLVYNSDLINFRWWVIGVRKYTLSTRVRVLQNELFTVSCK